MNVFNVTEKDLKLIIKPCNTIDRRVRDHAVSSLRTYLDRTTPLSDLDCLKLWKGLFYSMWMSDKPLTQQRLARELADLLHVVARRSQVNFLTFLQAFWTTMAREWSGIEALRMDKFLYLVRCMVGRAFECLGAGKERWEDQGMLDRYLRILQAVPFDPRDAKIPNGLRFHVVDVYVEELDKVDTERTAPVEMLLAPLRQLGQETVTKAVRQRVNEALEDERLLNWQRKESPKVEGVNARGTINAEGVFSDSSGGTEARQDLHSEEEEFDGFGD